MNGLILFVISLAAVANAKPIWNWLIKLEDHDIPFPHAAKLEDHDIPFPHEANLEDPRHDVLGVIKFLIRNDAKRANVK